MRVLSVSVMCAVLVLSAVGPACAAVVPTGALHAGDKLKVTVFDHTDLSIETTISNAGQIVVPLAGSVQAEGRLPQQVSQTIVDRLRPYLVSPSVDISVTAPNTTAFYGGIATGTIPLRPGETLAMAANDAKLPPVADLRRVSLVRFGQTAGTFDLVAMRTSGDPGPLLEANDVVSFVPNPIAIAISGAVDAPVVAYLAPGEPLGNAFAQAKLAKDANLQRIAVVQPSVTIVAARNAALFAQPGVSGWSIVVPHASHVTMLGLVTKSGDVTLAGDQSLVTALALAGGVAKGGDLANVIVLGPDGTSKGIYDVTKFARGDFAANPSLADGDVAYVPQQPKTAVFMQPKALLLAALYVAKKYLHLEIPPK
jgi:polysaccharide export outer membrane protein